MASHPVTHPRSARQQAFERAVDVLRADFNTTAAHMAIDGQARAAYDRAIRRFAAETRAEAERGRLSWEAAAEQASAIRNVTMEKIRWRSTPVGRAFAERIKSQGRTLNELIAKYTVKFFGPGADFNRLSSTQRNQVFAEIVAASGRSDRVITPLMRRISFAGRSMLLLSLAIAVYDIATAKDHVKAAKHEAAVLGSGVAGGIAAGALAGLACGPGAPLCVTVGAFVGGTAAALGADLFF